MVLVVQDGPTSRNLLTTFVIRDCEDESSTWVHCIHFSQHSRQGVASHSSVTRWQTDEA